MIWPDAIAFETTLRRDRAKFFAKVLGGSDFGCLALHPPHAIS
jgi:hypothetical protein